MCRSGRLTFILHFVCNRVSCLSCTCPATVVHQLLWILLAKHCSAGIIGNCFMSVQGIHTPVPMLAQPVCYPLSLSLILDKLLKVKIASDRKVTKLIFTSSMMIFFTLNVMSFICRTIKLTVKPLPEKDIQVRGRWGQKMN